MNPQILDRYIMVTQFDDDQLKFSMITELRSGVCFSVEVQNWGALGPAPLGWGVADPLEIHPFPTCVTLPNLDVLDQMVLAFY